MITNFSIYESIVDLDNNDVNLFYFFKENLPKPYSIKYIDSGSPYHRDRRNNNYIEISDTDDADWPLIDLWERDFNMKGIEVELKEKYWKGKEAEKFFLMMNNLIDKYKKSEGYKMWTMKKDLKKFNL